jgi:hypothetical protein
VSPRTQSIRHCQVESIPDLSVGTSLAAGDGYPSIINSTIIPCFLPSLWGGKFESGKERGARYVKKDD